MWLFIWKITVLMIIIKASVICLGILINYRAYNVLFLVLSVTFSFFWLRIKYLGNR